MKHARDDYNRIQDPARLIPDDEPVFLLRGQDQFAAEVLRYYAYLVQRSKGHDEMLVQRTVDQAAAMDAWPKKKAPDLAFGS
jgi:hypothetical protein